MLDKNLQVLLVQILERLMIDLQAEKELPLCRELVAKKHREGDMDLKGMYLDLDMLILLYYHYSDLI